MAELISCISRRGTFEEIKNIVDSGANVRHKDRQGMSALHWCSMYNHAGYEETGNQVIRFLVDRGAEVNATDHYRKTPLMYFVDSECDAALISALLDCGANVSFINSQGYTAMHNYTKASHLNFSVFRRLAEGLSDINVRDSSGETPLMNSLMNGNDREYIQLLLEAGSDVTCSSEFNNTVLHYYAIWSYGHYAQESNLQILTTLNGEGTHLNTQNMDGVTPLMRFAENNLPETELLFLLNRGAEINTCDKNGNSILHYVFLCLNQGERYNDVIQMLLEYGADPNARNKCGESPLSKAIYTGESVHINLLYNYGLSRVSGHESVTIYLIKNYVSLCNMQSRTYQVVFKHMLLESETALDHYITKELTHYRNLRLYVDSLIGEVRRMKVRIVFGEHLLFEFVAGSDRRKISSLLIRAPPVNYNIWNIEFPQYADVIISKFHILDRLASTLHGIRHMTIASKPEPDLEMDEIQLNLDCSSHVLKFVTDRDLKNLLLALENQ